uniref:Uncharacterized protein n=1 Tax=Rhizophora mucronata TaxID=61149 RepID=A0A2P2Q227_RHIMU
MLPTPLSRLFLFLLYVLVSCFLWLLIKV